MNQSKSTPRRSGFGTGTTSLLMIFTVLCFATLAMLTLSTAASNARIQQRSLQGTAALAAAEGTAAEAFARLDAAWAKAAPSATLAEVATPLGWEKTEQNDVFQFVAPVEDDHQLVTQVQASSGGPLLVVRQQAVYTGQWTPAPPGQLWGGTNTP